MAWGANYSIIFGIIILGLFGSTQLVFAEPYLLSNGPGDGTVIVGVNGFGGFGSFNGPDASDAFFDPGASSPAQTTLASAIAIRLGTEEIDGARAFLTSGGFLFGSPDLPNPPIAGTPTSATSTFFSNDLQFDLIQTLTKTSSGTTLTQKYTITNPTTSTIEFELIRYLDGDLQFDSSIDDAGGRLINSDGVEILFETDAVGDSSTSTTFVGVTSEGGTVPMLKRYEMNEFDAFGIGVFLGDDLLNLIFNDLDADQFIDTAYDVSLALRNEFSLGADESVVYVTKTIFGSGAPEDVEIDPPTEEMVGGIILPIDTMALLIAGAKFNAFFILSTLALTGAFAFGVLYYKTKRVN